MYSKVKTSRKSVDAMKSHANVLNILPEALKADTAFTVKYLTRRMKTEVTTQVADPVRVLSNAIENRYDHITKEPLKHCKYVNAVDSEVVPLIKNIENVLFSGEEPVQKIVSDLVQQKKELQVFIQELARQQTEFQEQTRKNFGAIDGFIKFIEWTAVNEHASRTYNRHPLL
jgi:ElaB/YqjD/DUF883 family membrane-anchored ribosome-binding protein